MSIKRNELSKHISNFSFMLSCIKKVSLVSLLVLVVTGIVKGILPLIQSFVNKEIIDYISVQSDNGFSKEILILLLLLVFFQGLSFFIVWSENYVSQHVGDKIGNYFRNLIINKCRKVQYKNYYNSEFYNQLEKASSGVSSSPLHSVQTIVMFFVMASRMLVSLWILSSFNVIVVLILVTFAIPSAYIDSKHRVRSFDLSNKLAPDRRRISYLFGLFYNKKALKELRINNAEDYIQTKANEAFDKYHEMLVASSVEAKNDRYLQRPLILEDFKEELLALGDNLTNIDYSKDNFRIAFYADDEYSDYCRLYIDIY